MLKIPGMSVFLYNDTSNGIKGSNKIPLVNNQAHQTLANDTNGILPTLSSSPINHSDQ